MQRIINVLVIGISLTLPVFSAESPALDTTQSPTEEALRIIRAFSAHANEGEGALVIIFNVLEDDPKRSEYYRKLNDLMLERYRTKVVGLGYLGINNASDEDEVEAMREWARIYSAVIAAFNMGKYGSDWGTTAFLEVARELSRGNGVSETNVEDIIHGGE